MNCDSKKILFGIKVTCITCGTILIFSLGGS